MTRTNLNSNFQWLLRWTVVPGVLALATGAIVSCESARARSNVDVAAPRAHEPNVVFLDNPSKSSDVGRMEFKPLALAVVRRLPDASRLALMRDGLSPQPGLANLTPIEARRELGSFLVPTVEHGSDPAKAIQNAVNWLGSSYEGSHRPKLLFAHDDMRPDGPGAVDPVRVHIRGALEVDCVLTGVDDSCAPRLMAAWQRDFRSLRIYTISDRIQTKDALADLPLQPEQITF